MPVLRAELIRSVYRRYFTTAVVVRPPGRGARPDGGCAEGMVYYFHQCTECRRCSVFCPFGIDTAEVTMIGRELLSLVGCNITGLSSRPPTATHGNHLGVQPHGFKDSLDFAADELEEMTGLRIEVRSTRKELKSFSLLPRPTISARLTTTHCSATCCFFTRSASITPSALSLPKAELRTVHSHEMMKRLNAKIYSEAKRLGVKWILGENAGTCGVCSPVHGHHERTGGFSGSAGLACDGHDL